MATRKRAVTEDIRPLKKPRVESSSSIDTAIPSSTPSQTFTDEASIAETSFTTRSTSKRAKVYHCDFPDCDKAFDRPVRLQAHLRTHTDDRPFAREEKGCTKSFFKAEHLKAHVQNKHSDGADHVCTYLLEPSGEEGGHQCGKAFTTATRLRRHVAAHERKDELKCDICDQCFRKMETLQRHIKKEHLKVKAFVCMRPVVDVDAMVDPAGGLVAMDEVCGQEFSTVNQLKAHENREHTGLRHFCEFCSSSTPNNDSLNDIDAPMHEITSVGFPTYNELQAHIKDVHPPICAICSKACASNRDLAAHMDIEHASSLSDRKQRFPCTFQNCDRSFTRKGNLNVHIQAVHVKQKKFVCGHFDLSGDEKVPGWDSTVGCGQGFSTKATLESHVRTRHLDLPNLRPRKSRGRMVKSEDGSSISTPMEVDEPPEFAADDTNALSMLTGYGYGNFRAIACWMKGCPVRFRREFDLARHMKLLHGWTVEDVNERFVEMDALGGGQFWIGGDGDGNDGNKGLEQEAEDEALRMSLTRGLSLREDVRGLLGDGSGVPGSFPSGYRIDITGSNPDGMLGMQKPDNLDVAAQLMSARGGMYDLGHAEESVVVDPALLAL